MASKQLSVEISVSFATDDGGVVGGAPQLQGRQEAGGTSGTPATPAGSSRSVGALRAASLGRLLLGAEQRFDAASGAPLPGSSDFYPHQPPPQELNMLWLSGIALAVVDALPAALKDTLRGLDARAPPTGRSS